MCIYDKIAVMDMKKWVSKGICAAAAGLLFAVNTVPVNAVEVTDVPVDGTVYLVDFASGEIIDNYNSFYYARSAFSQLAGEYENLCIVDNGKLLQAEHAIVKLPTDDACSVVTTYVNAVDGLEGFVNGCYGIDAVYLGTNQSGDQIEFMISGASGWVSADDVEIIPVENIKSRLSQYIVVQGTLYHEIKNSMEDDNYASIVNGGDAPAYLKEGESYYSYDGHYFYGLDDLTIMMDDMQNGVHDGSVNPEDPYYDYYQFVSHRTLSNAQVTDLENYFSEDMGLIGSIARYNDDDKDMIDDTLTRSQLYGTAQAFFQYQYQYGSNALMMLAMSESESAYGRSSLSYTRNNLYSHAAYESEEEAAEGRYQSPVNSIYSHAKYYISGTYCSPLKAEYHGGFFGNKSAGMNVSYSADPYWGEKAAAYYRNLDRTIGAGDGHSYTIGIKTNDAFVYVFQYPENGSKVLYNSGQNPDMAFVILGHVINDYGEWYKVQSEATLNADSLIDLSYDYDYENDLGYIKAEDIDILLEGSNEEKEYNYVTFDANGGEFPGKAESITYTLPAGSTAAAVTPVKKKALFTGWDGDPAALNGDTVLHAQYRDVRSIEMKQNPQQDYELYDRISLKNGIVLVHFEDGTDMDVPLSSSMVSGYSLDKAGDGEVVVSYAGCTTSYAISVSAEKDTLRNTLKDEILRAISKYQDKEQLNEDDAKYLISLKQKIDDSVLPYLTQNQLRSFDTILRKAVGEKIRYIIEENTYELGVSGLTASLPLADSLNRPEFQEDTYRVKITGNISDLATTALARTTAFIDNQIHESFRIELIRNFETFDPDAPILYTIRKPENATEGEVFTVLYFDPAEGDVVQCYTRQTDQTITFMGWHNGEYMVTSRRTSNEYSGVDPKEAVSADTVSFDMEQFIIALTVSAGVILISILLFTLIHRIRRKRKVANMRVIKDEEKSKEPAPPVDFTQAMYVFETEVLNLDEIRKAEEAAKQEEAQTENTDDHEESQS